MTDKKQKIINIFFIVLSIFAALKMLFFAFGLDEEYQVVMAYRNAIGDRLFWDMWEPHQSSAFLCTLLMKPYLCLFGTTGIVLYLRAWGTLLHLCVSLYLGKVMKTIIGKKYAWLLSLICFNTIPKQIILPEFGIMQVWFYTLLCLYLIQYYNNGRKIKYLIFAALALALNILAYPSCLILFPFVLALVAYLSGKRKWRDMGIMTLVCGLCGIGYLGMLFTYLSPGQLLTTLQQIISSDETHTLSLKDKSLLFLQKGIYLAMLWSACRLIAWGIVRWKKYCKETVYCLTIMLACAVQIFYWTILNIGYETMSIHLATIMLVCIPAHKMLHEKSSSKTNMAALLWYCTLGAALSLLAVSYLTNLSLTESIPHAMPAAFFGIALLILSAGKKQENRYSKWVYGTLVVWCFTAIFGKCYSLRAGAEYSNVLQSGGILKSGPAAGTISSYFLAYVYNCDYEDWQIYLQDGDRVLIMVDQIRNLGTIQYLFKDVEICHFSTLLSSPYDETLPEYWAAHPEKVPNVIIVDCWYGQLMTDPDGWMMQYIESDFGYTQVNDGRYIRIFRR